MFSNVSFWIVAAAGIISGFSSVTGLAFFSNNIKSIIFYLSIGCLLGAAWTLFPLFGVTSIGVLILVYSLGRWLGSMIWGAALKINK